MIMYNRIRDLTHYVLEAKRRFFSLGELFEVVTGQPKNYLGKRSHRHIAKILSEVGFSVTIHSSVNGTRIELETDLKPEEVMSRAGDLEWNYYCKDAPSPPRGMILAYRNLPAIMRQIEIMSRKGLPVKREDLEKLCRLAGYPLKK